MIKKIFAVILTVLMIIPFAVVSFAAEPVELSLTNEKVYAGDEFAVNLFISDNSNVSAAAVNISYDKTALQYISSEPGAILDENAFVSVTDKNSIVRFSYISPNSSITSAGVLVSLRFKALDNASGETKLTISIDNKKDLVTNDIFPIPYKAVNSSVEIINSTYAGEENTDFQTEAAYPSESSDITASAKSENTEDTEAGNKNNKIILAVGVTAACALIAAGAAVLVIKSKKNKK